MNNYRIMGIVFILVLGMLQLISINIRLRMDKKLLNVTIKKLESEIEQIGINNLSKELTEFKELRKNKEFIK